MAAIPFGTLNQFKSIPNTRRGFLHPSEDSHMQELPLVPHLLHVHRCVRDLALPVGLLMRLPRPRPKEPPPFPFLSDGFTAILRSFVFLGHCCLADSACTHYTNPSLPSQCALDMMGPKRRLILRL